MCSFSLCTTKLHGDVSSLIEQNFKCVDIILQSERLTIAVYVKYSVGIILAIRLSIKQIVGVLTRS